MDFLFLWGMACVGNMNVLHGNVYGLYEEYISLHGGQKRSAIRCSHTLLRSFKFFQNILKK